MVMKVVNALNWRYAVRKFSAEAIADEQVRELMTATSLSASSYGLQPYRLLVVKSAEIRRQLLEHSFGQEKVVHCSHLVVFAAQTDIGDRTVERYLDRVSEVRGLPRRELRNMAVHFKGALAAKTQQQKQEWAHQQAYIALGTFLTCAAMMQIDSCPMAGIEPQGYDRVLGLADKELTTTVICAIGRRHPEDANAGLRKVRYDQDEMVAVI